MTKNRQYAKSKSKPTTPKFTNFKSKLTPVIAYNVPR